MCFQPWCTPLWSTGLRAPTNSLLIVMVMRFFVFIPTDAYVLVVTAMRYFVCSSRFCCPGSDSEASLCANCSRLCPHHSGGDCVTQLWYCHNNRIAACNCPL